MEFSNSMYDLGSPVSAGPLQVLQLAEDLKLSLELRPSQEERNSLRAQLPAETAQALVDWLQSGAVSTLCDSFWCFSVDRLLQAVFMHKIVASNGNVTFPLSVFEFVSVDFSVMDRLWLFMPLFAPCLVSAAENEHHSTLESLRSSFCYSRLLSVRIPVFLFL